MAVTTCELQDLNRDEEFSMAFVRWHCLERPALCEPERSASQCALLRLEFQRLQSSQLMPEGWYDRKDTVLQHIDTGYMAFDSSPK
jgi:hypothetical protein